MFFVCLCTHVIHKYISAMHIIAIMQNVAHTNRISHVPQFLSQSVGSCTSWSRVIDYSKPFCSAFGCDVPFAVSMTSDCFTNEIESHCSCNGMSRQKRTIKKNLLLSSRHYASQRFSSMFSVGLCNSGASWSTVFLTRHVSGPMSKICHSKLVCFPSTDNSRDNWIWQKTTQVIK